MTDNPYRDFDAVEREFKDIPVSFKVGGEEFTANMNLNAGDTLMWMRASGDLSSTPKLIEMVLGEDEFDRFIKVLKKSKTGANFLIELVEYLGEHLQVGDSGN